MITVLLNNQTTTINEQLSLQEFLVAKNYATQGIAVVINQNIIPKAHYNTQKILAGDSIEILLPMQGG